MVIQKDGDYNITRRNFIAKPEGKTKTLCKCFCRQLINHSQPILNHYLANSLPFFSAKICKQSMGTRNRLGIELSYRPVSAGILQQSMGARNPVGIELSYPALQARKAGRIGSLE
jgi:hypothetical protein